MDTDAAVGGGKKIDMVAEREPGAAHARAGFEEQVGETRLVLHLRDVERKGVRSVHRRHGAHGPRTPFSEPANEEPLVWARGPLPSYQTGRRRRLIAAGRGDQERIKNCGH